MKLDEKERRAFIALACKVAWADGVVEDEEREHVSALLARLGSPVSPGELEAWLSTGAPPAEIEDLSPALREMFIYEAMGLVESDGKVSPAELKLVEGLLARVAKNHPPASAKVGQVVVVPRPVRRA
jgi:tellurite resistance protein